MHFISASFLFSLILHWYRFYGQDLHTKNITKDIITKSSFLASLGAGVAGLETRKTGIHFVAKNIPLGIISKYLIRKGKGERYKKEKNLLHFFYNQ